MPGDSHLPIFSYDAQSAKEVVHKTDVLLRTGINVDLEMLLEYEKSHANRASVVKHFEKLLRGDGIPSEDKESGEGAPDDHDQMHGQAGAAGNR